MTKMRASSPTGSACKRVGGRVNVCCVTVAVGVDSLTPLSRQKPGNENALPPVNWWFEASGAEFDGQLSIVERDCDVVTRCPGGMMLMGRALTRGLS